METGRASEESRKDLRDLAGGGLVNFAGKFGRSFRGAFLWVVTLLCGLEVQALYSLSWGLVSVLNRVALFGLNRGVVRFVVLARVARDEEEAERSVGTGLQIGLLSSALVVALLLLGAGPTAAFYDKPIAGALGIMAWVVPFLTVSSILLAATRALRIMRYDVYVRSIAGPLILLAGGLAAGTIHPTLTGVAWAQLAMALGISLLAVHYFRRFFALGNCLRRVGRRPSWGRMGRFSLPVMLTDLLYGVQVQLDVLMLGWFVAREQVYLVGLFVLARRIASALLKVPQAFDPIFSSIVTQLSSQARNRELTHRFAVISRWILTVNLPIFFGLLIIGRSLLPMMAGKEILTLGQEDLELVLNILFILCTAMMVQSLSAAVEPLLGMSGRPHLNLINNGLWLGSNFLLNVVFISAWGILGAAVGSLLSMALVTGVRFLEVHVIYGVQPLGRSQLKPLAAALGAGLAGWLIHEAVPAGAVWTAAASLAGFLGIYVALLRFLGIAEEDELLLRRVRRRLSGFLGRREVNS